MSSRANEARGGALVLVKATREPEIEQTTDRFSLVSKNVEGIQPDDESDDYEYNITGLFPMTSFFNIALQPGERAVIRVTDIRRTEGPPKKCELTYSDCWKVNDITDKEAMEKMQTEIALAALVCKRRKQLRRKGSTVESEDTQDIVEVFTPAAKRAKRYSEGVTSVAQLQLSP